MDDNRKIGETELDNIKIIDITNSKPNEFENKKSNILDNFKRNVNDLKDNIDYLFEYFNNNQFLSILGVLLLPIFGERTITPIAKNIDINYKLNLRRRNPNFTGKWIFETSIGNSYIIVRESKDLKLFENTEKTTNFKFIKGFDLSRTSLLYKALLLSSKPGIFIDQIQKIQKDFLQIESFDINWETWLENNLFQYINQKEKYPNTICKSLRKLVEDHNNDDLCLTDILMFAHIIDCCDSLSITKKNFY